MFVGQHRTGGIRILLISNMWPSDHAPVFGSFVARHVEGLRAAGADVTVVANDDARTGPVRTTRKYLSLALRARRAARAKTYDVVVGHYLYPTAAFAFDASRAALAPLVLVSHGTDARSVMRDDRFGRAGRTALSQASLVVAVSDSLRISLRETVGVPESVPIEVVNMGFDAELFRPDASARSTLGLKDGERVVLFAGNLVHTKGVDVLVDAFRKLLDTGAADRLVIVGDGPLEGPLRERIAELIDDDTHADPTGHVTMTGPLGQRDLARWMAAADVFALPSRHEGLGLVLLEAMGCGTPCVASDVGGIPELIDSSVGALVDPDNEDSLGIALTEVLASGKERFREACIERASHHTSSAKAEEFLAHIEGVVERDGSGTGGN